MKENTLKNNLINDVSGICTVMKYSFADLRDIIKGTDLWDQNKDAERLQENLKTIFGKIKGTLGAKYARDDPPYTNLRQNWWEAMKCRIPELRAIPDKQDIEICVKKWNHNEDMLNKLNEEWTMEHNEHIFDIPPSTLDDIHKINDETYSMISTNNIYYQDHNNKIPLDNLGSINILPNDLTTQNNIFQTNKLRTNISIDIHFDENNNNVENTNVTDDDHFENLYNF
ncbi:erythrocyte membrane protein 1 (PfEMP1), exon 2, putative [Plasmodium sp.]|nr:erythrocyte membrane protein 1 (PfEMP1), exon 2, putative [Plasmodium sp.]